MQGQTAKYRSILIAQRAPSQDRNAIVVQSGDDTWLAGNSKRRNPRHPGTHSFWTADPDEIIEKVRRGKEALN